MFFDSEVAEVWQSVIKSMVQEPLEVRDEKKYAFNRNKKVTMDERYAYQDIRFNDMKWEKIFYGNEWRWGMRNVSGRHSDIGGSELCQNKTIDV